MLRETTLTCISYSTWRSSMPKLNHCSIDQVYLVAKSIPVKWITSIVLSHFEGPDSPPKNFTAFAISSRSAHLSWLPPPREHRNGLIRHFWINITEINTGRKFERTLFSTATVLSSLHPYYTYQFSVAAYRKTTRSLEHWECRLQPAHKREWLRRYVTN